MLALAYHLPQLLSFSLICQEVPSYLDLDRLKLVILQDPDLHQVAEDKRLAVIQSLYVATGCDYVSFFNCIGKVKFMKWFLQHAFFVSAEVGSLSDGVENGFCRSFGWWVWPTTGDM